MFTSDTIKAIAHVSHGVASDMDEPYNGDDVCVAETTLDTLSVAHRAASDEVTNLVRAYGYDAVLTAARKIVVTA